MQKMCRTCVHWYTTRPWQGQCDLHPWPHTRWSETARVPACPDYIDRLQHYRRQQAALGPDPDAEYDRRRELRDLEEARDV